MTRSGAGTGVTALSEPCASSTPKTERRRARQAPGGAGAPPLGTDPDPPKQPSNRAAPVIAASGRPEGGNVHERNDLGITRKANLRVCSQQGRVKRHMLLQPGTAHALLGEVPTVQGQQGGISDKSEALDGGGNPTIRTYGIPGSGTWDHARLCSSSSLQARPSWLEVERDARAGDDSAAARPLTRQPARRLAPQ